MIAEGKMMRFLNLETWPFNGFFVLMSVRVSKNGKEKVGAHRKWKIITSKVKSTHSLSRVDQSQFSVWLNLFVEWFTSPFRCQCPLVMKVVYYLCTHHVWDPLHLKCPLVQKATLIGLQASVLIVGKISRSVIPWFYMNSFIWSAAGPHENPAHRLQVFLRWQTISSCQLNVN